MFSEHCRALAHPGLFTVALASLLVIGIFFSYLPQLGKIWVRKTSAGLSPWWILLGGLSSIAAAGNIFTLPASRDDMACCRELTAGQCAAALLGVAQIGIQFMSFMFIVIFYFAFSPTTADDTDNAADLAASTASISHTNPAKRRDPVIVGVAIITFLVFVAFTSAALVSVYPSHTQTWANVLGVIAGGLSAVQYFPQIYHTYCIHDLQSLSVPTLAVQAPGAFVFAFSLWLRVGWEGWSTWLVYCITGLLQIVLLGLATQFYLERRDARHQQCLPVQDSSDEEDEDEQVADGATERTALIAKTNQLETSNS